jgi:uncharacterized protein YgiB involved in biofilm formation
MKRSKQISLVLIGTMALTGVAGCGPSPEEEIHADLVKTTQNHYKTVAECQQDWGTDARDCQPAPANHPHGGGFVSPMYIWSHGSGHPYAVYPDGTSRQLPNSYLAKGTPPVSGVKAVTSSMNVPSNSAVSSVASSRGAVVSRGGFGSSARGFSGGGGRAGGSVSSSGG